MTECEQVGNVKAASNVFRMVKEEEGNSNAKSSIGGGSGADGGSEDQEHLRVYGAAISCCHKAREPEWALLLLRKIISKKLEPNMVTYNTVIAALSKGRPESKTAKDNSLWEKALAIYRVMKLKHVPVGVSLNCKMYNMLVCCLSANLQPRIAKLLLIDMHNAGFIPNVDLHIMTVWCSGACS
jgi:pentatricopeptide repeat protein